MPSSKAWLSKPENQEKLRISRKKWADKNREIVLEKQRAAREANRDEYNAYMREYHQKNKAVRVKYINAHRRGKLVKATPSWANKPAIRKIYVNCPAGYHVDHIIPLHGVNVSGLHVENNLQYLPARENIQKGNYFAIHAEG
jgi:hypothetical protein